MLDGIVNCVSRNDAAGGGGYGTVCLLALVLSTACAGMRSTGAPRPNEPCGSTRRTDNLLTGRWQQCWFTATHGRWRTLKHELHYDSLVVDVEATTFDDAREIANRFIENQPGFHHLTLYVYLAPASTPQRVRRVSWSQSSGFDELDYDL